ncbi:uncharacterized protein LOC124269695 [Haliotis rubra]|uniref:uncharacterized protein LOC124269695 n=1 Tax=Haliotis rubra TaxID=36100 RepID=UPI001EE4FF70|nr:uncharacterized protein LOC124269695 [Haliotis rubra]XP_046560686.1 uncharacterized protein LOC124269695 [Haliotis rubra]
MTVVSTFSLLISVLCLVENIESRYVSCRQETDIESTTLMVEVARRLSRLGDTLLICNSQEEKSRLRSVYSSTISVLDVEGTDLSKFQNLVHETNSYLFEPSGRQWKFLKGTQHRSHTTKNQTTETSNRKEDGCQVFHTKDFLRPQLQQAEGDITEIRRHYTMIGGVNIIPVSLTSHLVDIKDMLLSVLETDKSLFHCNIVTGAELDLSDDEKCLVHLTESLATTLDFPVSERPSEIRCDMFLALPKQPPVVLTVMNCEHESKMITNYNTSVAREVTAKLRRFTSENLNVIHGVVSKNDMKDNEVFFAKLQKIAAVSSVFISKASLMMNSFKYDQILMAFWAALAETKVDVQESQLKFLNKEQCILLLENLNRMNVEVRLHSSSEATTLMLEVARRLSRLGNTLLICRIREERDRLRSVYSSTISMNDVWKTDLSAYENIVHDARSLPQMPSGCRVWRFKTVTGIRKRKKHSEQNPTQPLVDSLPHASLGDYASVTPSMDSLKKSVSDTSQEGVASLSSQDSPEDLSSERSGSQITTLEETHDCFEDAKKLTKDLDIVEKEEDKNIVQLSPLYAAERQNPLHYLSRIIDSLSRFREQSRLDTMIPDNKAAIAQHVGIILSVEQGDRLVYVKGTPVLCPELHLDAARANTRWCQVTADGELINSPSHTPSDQERHRLQEYWGTCTSTPIPFPPSYSTFAPVYSTPRYWETFTRLRVVVGSWCLVLEMGVSEAGQVGRVWWVSDQRRSWCVNVESCDIHPGSVCTTVYREGERGECQQNTVFRTPGTQATLHYGVVLDVARGRLAFVDLNREIVLAKFDEIFTEDLYPMFGVWSDELTINMRLVSGEDIDITDTKKSLIHHALT